MNVIINWKMILIHCAVVVGFASIGCGDDHDDGESDWTVGESGGETIQVSGDVSAYYNGDGGDISHRASTHPHGSILVAEGELSSDGTFSIQFKGGDEITDALGPAVGNYDNVNSNHFRGFVCIDEFIDDLGDALFLSVPVFTYFPSNAGDGAYILPQIGLSTTKEATELGVDPFPEGEEIYVSWLYSTKALTVRETCNDGEIDVVLSSGWNELYLDNTDKANRYQWTGERPDEVVWIKEELNRY